MKLKGLVWFFTIALILISVWELSYTWVVRSYEGTVKAQAERMVKPLIAGLSAEDKAAVINAKAQHILDSTKDKSIYPVVGTTYQKCKENELNLGLDLQGGISVTMDVSLEGLLKSLSNNAKDPQLIKALQTATARKINSEADYITLFTDAFIQDNGANKLHTIFAGSGKDIKPNESDAEVISTIKTTAKNAIKETYKILLKRIDKFGVAQPNINLDENKGIISVELAGITDPERVRKLLQASANLQFWEVYTMADDAFQKAFDNANKAFDTYMRSIDTTKAKDSNMLVKVIRIMPPLSDKSGNPIVKNNKYQWPSGFAVVNKADTGKFFEYLNLDVVKNNIPTDVKFLFGEEQKPEKGDRYFPLYAIKLQPGTDKAPLEGEGVENSKADFDQVTGQPIISMQMTPIGAKTWGRLTTNNVGKPIAIVLDDIVYSAPNINEPITTGNSQISGSFTIEQTQDLANTLKSGRVNAPAKIVAEEVVGPTLGQQALHGGALAFAIAFVIIFGLMLIYYNTGGWVANIALIFNLLFTVGVLTAMGFTLTAAGIAGLVLTIGLAVDTNVIIFERIKEELTKGKSYPNAVSEGYKRSLAPVLDAHITSLLTAFILVYFGLGPVLGFATTQIIGIILSLFCGILVSRLITDFWTKKNRHFNYFTGVSKKIFKHASYKFIEYRKVAYVISGFVLLAGIASFFYGFHEGVEFKGGRSYTIGFDKPVNGDLVRDDLKAAFGDYPVIKTIGDGRHLNITTAYLKGVDNADSAVQTKLFEGLKKALPATTTYAEFIKKNKQSSTTVQPSISDDLKRGAVKATIFAMLIIFVYIFVRFRDWRYSAGTILTLLHDVLVTLAVFSFFKDIVPFPLEIDQHFIAAVLTVIGFSMNDTVIVFDRIREYSRDMKGASKTTIINRAINDTLSRTIMTSLTVFLTLLVLFIFGGEVTRGFAFAMLIGVITGTYSSIFVGAPILVDFAKNKPLGAADTKQVTVTTKSGTKTTTT